MNLRIDYEPTPEGRLAVVARIAMTHVMEAHREPDYADFRDALKPFVERELILARIDEARKASGLRLTNRVAELAKELLKVNARIPKDIGV